MRTKIDAIDKKIIETLQQDGRASFSAIAREVKVSDVAIKKRFESLKRRGIIEAVRAKINLKALGYENPIFVQIRSEISKNKTLIEKLSSFDNVRELYQVLGEYNLLAKIIVPNLEQAEKFIEQIGLIDGVIDIKTLVVLSELKNETGLPSQTLQKTLEI